MTQRIEVLLEKYWTQISSPSDTLKSAMHYAVCGGGKRLRPLLVYVVGQTYGLSLETLDIPAASVELIHSYSLVHDDLPMIDNDDWRRGKPSCHKVFGEAIALLAGDALLTLAFELLSGANFSPEKVLAMTRVLAKAIGMCGMIGGQALDVNEPTASITRLHRLKTGSLMAACLQLVGLGADVSSAHLGQLERLGHCLGCAYQIQDDLQDQPQCREEITLIRLQRLFERINQLQEQLFQDQPLRELLRMMFPKFETILFERSSI